MRGPLRLLRWRFKVGGRGQCGVETSGSTLLDHSAPIVEEQLKRAGARLAKILNDAIG